MYKCQACGEEFATFDEYSVHRFEEVKGELEAYLSQLRAGMKQSMAVSIMTACIQSGKSVDEAMKIYSEALRKLMDTGMF